MQTGNKIDRSKYLYPKTVKGKPYLYFRMADGGLVRLPLDQHSADFKRCYDDCLKSRNGGETGAGPYNGGGGPVLVAPTESIADTHHVKFLPGTIGHAISKYLASSEFEGCKPSTAKKYRAAFDSMRDLLGATMLRDMDTDAVDIYSEKIATRQVGQKRGKPIGGPAVASLQVKMIANLWKVCRKFPEFKIKGRPNPTIDAAERYTVKQPAKPWTEAQQDLFMETASPRLKLAKLLLHFSAQRGGDCVKMKWTDFDGLGLFVMPEKSSTGDDLEPNYHLCPKPLLDALLARQAEGELGETILLTRRGKPWATAESLSQSIRDHLVKIGLAKRFTKTISMHGLRKNAASEVGSLLLGPAGVKSVTGHVSDEMANYYSKHADKIALNKAVVNRWDAKLAEKAAAKTAERRASLRAVK
jgi:integrase